MITKTVYLEPLSSFGGERLHSDTIFGAICWGVKHTCGETKLEEILDRFEKKDPPFILSSAYPFLKKEGIHYLPKPLKTPLKKRIESREILEKLKHLKKLFLLPEDMFNKYIGGKITDEDLFDGLKLDTKKFPRVAQYEIDGKKYIQRGNTLLEEGIKTPLFQTMDVQRNKINRLNKPTELFHQSETFFPHGVNLSFLIKIFDYEKEIKTALNFLQDRGIGGDVSVGKGNFLINYRDVNVIKEPSDATVFTTLSIYCPTDDEIEYYKNNGERLWYRLVRRKGKIESSFVKVKNVWKDTLYVFSESSTFPIMKNKTFYGHNPVVKKEPFNVQQYGYAYSVKVKL